jgi:glycosyltransferase involved in cell wall biosynthesis
MDVVTDGVNGLMIAGDVLDPRDFCSKVRVLQDSLPIRNRLIENGLFTVRETFSWYVVLPQYRKLLGLGAQS